MKGLFQCPPWTRSFCPLPFPSAGDRWFRACRAKRAKVQLDYLCNYMPKCSSAAATPSSSFERVM